MEKFWNILKEAVLFVDMVAAASCVAVFTPKYKCRYVWAQTHEGAHASTGRFGPSLTKARFYRCSLKLQSRYVMKNRI